MRKPTLEEKKKFPLLFKKPGKSLSKVVLKGETISEWEKNRRELDRQREAHKVWVEKKNRT